MTTRPWATMSATARGKILRPIEDAALAPIDRLAEEAGKPPGVLNVMTGFEDEVGQALVVHPDVAKVTFTRSDSTAAWIYAQAAQGMKRVAMELGGKLPNIIFEDANLGAAAAGAVAGIFGATGQMCTAGSRPLVQNPVKDEVTAKILSIARQIKLGDPIDPETPMGPVPNKPQYDKVLRFIAVACDLAAGTTWDNTYRTYPFMVPLGGRRRFGLGPENGIEGLHEFLETKSIKLSTADVTQGFVPR